MSLVFLKLGGAVLTEKDRRETVRPGVLRRLVGEVAAWPGTAHGRLVLAHGSGSFAHMAAVETGFVAEPGDPRRLARVSAAARRLNSTVIDELLAADLPAVPVPGSLLAVSSGGETTAVRHELVRALLASRLLPVLYGDAVPDAVLGGAIANTESLLARLARDLRPDRLILATDVDGVYARRPGDGAPRGGASEVVPVITPRTGRAVRAGLAGARPGVTDVTGGMAAKVEAMLALVQSEPRLQVHIVSGLRSGAVSAALRDDPSAGGTLIKAS